MRRYARVSAKVTSDLPAANAKGDDLACFEVGIGAHKRLQFAAACLEPAPSELARGGFMAIPQASA